MVCPILWTGAASAGLAGAARPLRGSGSANEFGARAQVIEPEPWSWIAPADRQVASSAKIWIVLPPLRLKPMFDPTLLSAPLESDWTLPYASTTPEPARWTALHAVVFSASIENGNVLFQSFVATAKTPTGQVALPMRPAKIDFRFEPSSTSMNSGKVT